MRLLIYTAIVSVSYLIFSLPGLILGKPIPTSVLSAYVFFVAVIALLAMTTTDEGARKLASPLKKLFFVEKKSVRFAALLIIPAFFAFLTYGYIATPIEPSFELRVVHPAPPAVISAYGKTFELSKIENPYRKFAIEDREKFKELVRQGGDVYFKNCFFCHGAKLDGAGHFAKGLNPAPLPFKGNDTIAQLSESYVFWRVVKGGAGLPQESHPHMSSMPAWEERLTEDEAWKVILFIYDFTGNSPRRWK
ncbi:MAG: cytochrome c [Thermodesulfobacteriota bacterium]